MTVKYLTAPDGYKIAYKNHAGEGPTFIWCGGLKSDMDGGKAVHLHEWARSIGQSFIRFDYFGHGISGGEFTDGTISRWSADVCQIIDELTDGHVILIGSSMGGWSSLLAAIDHPDRVKGLLLINPAPDFTEKLTYASWSVEQKTALKRDGIVYEPSGYDEPYAYSAGLIEDGRARQILDAPIPFCGPVHILQGEADTVVPWEYSMKILGALESPDVDYTLVKGGDHSLSRPEDLDRLIRSAEVLRRKVCAK
ncbi:MAG: alpha/beta hydrolase [Maricaulaceae bacterium]